MKLRISELLDDWEDSSVELVPPPEVSPERIRKRTMELLNTKTHSKSRLLRRGLACALLAAALTVSAVAAYQIWGPGDLFDSFFALEGAPLDQGQKDLLNELGTTDLAPSVSGGVTLTPLAAVADEHTLYLRLRVEAPEGTQLPDMGEQEDHAFEDIRLEDAAGASLNWGMQKARFLPDAVPGDNVLELVFFLCGQPGSANWNDGTDKILSLSNLRLCPGSDGTGTVLNGTWTFPLSHFCRSQAVDVDTAGAVWVDEEHQNTLTLDYLQLSPLSAAYRLSCTDPSLVPLDDVGIDLVLTDGSVVSLSCGNGTFGPDFMEGTETFDSPIPLDRVDHIQFGSHSLPLPNTAVSP